MRAYDGIRMYELSDLSLIPPRAPTANKGSCGHVLVIAGSKGMSGAAYLSALAAYRTGAGLVRILTPEANRAILQIQLPEAVITVYEEETLLREREAWKAQLSDLIAWSSVIVLGPGLGKEPYVRRLVGDVMEASYVPVIVDADGLNAIAEEPSLTGFYTENMILTPHVGEFSRLTNRPLEEILGDLSGAAAAYRDRYGVTICLKASESVTATVDGALYRTASGTAALAKAGSGDVLTGVIAGLICLGFDEGQAASFGSFLHGLAGREAAKKSAAHGILAREIAAEIPCVMRQIPGITV